MEKLKSICKTLDRLHIKYRRSDDNQHIVIRACEVGDNFYDYDETPKPVKFSAGLEILAHDHRICILKCDECRSCAGW